MTCVEMLIEWSERSEIETEKGAEKNYRKRKRLMIPFRKVLFFIVFLLF